MKTSLYPLFALLVISLLLSLPACDDEPTAPEGPSLIPIPSPTAPESLIAALEVIYNEAGRSAIERRDAYASLLFEGDPPMTGGFIFRFQPSDIGTDPGGTGVPIPPSWGRSEEIAAHERIFTAQEDSAIYSLILEIQHTEAEDIEPPEMGKEGWKRVFAFNVHLRLMFSPHDGLEVDGGQAEFDCAPVGDRWSIGEWKDLPRPFAPGPRLEVEATTWGSIKASWK